MKKIATGCLLGWLLCCSAVVKAQLNGGVPDHVALMNPTWEKFDLLMYKVEDKGDGYRDYIPQFPQELRALESKTVTLSGYMVPIQPGRDHPVFLLSVLPVMQCMFCGQQPGIPPMVQVFMKNGKARISDDPIKIVGKVHLNENPDKGAEIQILQAALQ